MDYEKKYKEALEWARKVMHGKVGFVLDEVLEKFPELKESEDEKIRKKLLELVAKHCGKTCEMYLWLEKQGKKDEEILILKDQIESLHAAIKAVKETHRIELEKQGEQSKEAIYTHEVVTGNGNIKALVTEKVQLPKFKVGDKIRRKTPSSCDKDMQVARIEKDYYVCNHIGKFSSEVVPFSKESSYELIEQKPAWSEEDEKQVRQIERIVHNDGCTQKLQKQISDWFKSIKDRVQPKQEWSGEDKMMLQYAIEHFERQKRNCIEGGGRKKAMQEFIDWLKFLRPQNTWKPSKQQIISLNYILNHYCYDIHKEEVSGLLEQLRKLKEE